MLHSTGAPPLPSKRDIEKGREMGGRERGRREESERWERENYARYVIMMISDR